MWVGAKRILVIVVLLLVICPALARMAFSMELDAQGLMAVNLFCIGIVVLLVNVMVVGGSTKDE